MAEKVYTGSFSGNGSAHGTGIASGLEGTVVINDGNLTMDLEKKHHQITGTFSYSADLAVSGDFPGFTQEISGSGTVSGHGKTLTLSGDTDTIIAASGTATIKGGRITVSDTWTGSFADFTGSGTVFGTLQGPMLKAEAADDAGAVRLSHAIASMGRDDSAPLTSTSRISNTADFATTLAPPH